MLADFFKDHLGGEGSCWWEKAMPVGKDRAEGRKSCWSGEIMSVGKDHAGCGR